MKPTLFHVTLAIAGMPKLPEAATARSPTAT